MKKKKHKIVDRAKAVDGQLILNRWIHSWRVDPEDVVRIQVGRVPSFVDEVAVYLEAEHIFSITDAYEGFRIVEDLLNLKQLFGDDWHQRAEAGEVMTWERP